MNNTLFQPQSLLYLDDIETACRNKVPMSENLRFCPGNLMPRCLGEAVDGIFGIQLVYNNKPLASLGFKFKDNRVYITQTPQALHGDLLDSEEKNFIRSVEFRSYLVEALIGIARVLNADAVVGYSVASHPTIEMKIKNGEITEIQAQKALDDVFEKSGFKLAFDGKYYLALEKTIFEEIL